MIRGTRRSPTTPTTNTQDTDMPDRAYLLFSTFITALEGGIGYWSRCETYRWRKPGTDDEDREGFEATVYVEGEGEAQRIDAGVLARGFELLQDEATRVSPTIREAGLRAWFAPDHADLDAQDADVIVQLGLLGEIVYG